MPVIPPYVLLYKTVGQTPLECMELWRQTKPELKDTPLAYAGRLDPMAEGVLLVLIGEECKKQADYHNLDKEYEFEILFGVHSDSGDVLDLSSPCCYSGCSKYGLFQRHFCLQRKLV